jgi:hypothetical protein
VSDASSWAAVAIATLALGVGVWQWRRTEARERRRDVRVGEVVRQQQLNASRQAVDRVVSRWRLSNLSTLNLATDPDIPAVAASAKRWRHTASDDLAIVAAPSPARRTLPYRLIEQAAQTLKDFESVIDPIALQWTPDQSRLSQHDPGWKTRLDGALMQMQTQMRSTIDELDAVSENASVSSDAMPPTRSDGETHSATSSDRVDDGRSSIYQSYTSLREFEENHGNIQAGIRGLASVWLLASLGAIAYLLRLNDGNASFVIAVDFGISVVCLLGVVGLSVLWSLDQLVYQNFLNAIFILALKMEHDYVFLPPIRTLESLNLRHGKGIGPRIRIFYFAPIYVLTAISILLSFEAISNRGRFSSAQPIVAIGTLMVALADHLIASLYRQAPKDRAADFGDSEFCDYVKKLRPRDGSESSGTITLQRYSPIL